MYLTLISSLLLLSMHCHCVEPPRDAKAMSRPDTHKDKRSHYEEALSSLKNKVYYKILRSQTKNPRQDIPQVTAPTNGKTLQVKLDRKSVTELEAMLKAQEIQEGTRYQRRKLDSGAPAPTRRKGSSGPTVQRRSNDYDYRGDTVSLTKRRKPSMVHLLNPVESRIPAPGKHITDEELRTYLMQRAEHLRKIKESNTDSDEDYYAGQAYTDAPQKNENGECDSSDEGEDSGDEVNQGGGEAVNMLQETEITPDGTIWTTTSAT